MNKLEKIDIENLLKFPHSNNEIILAEKYNDIIDYLTNNNNDNIKLSNIVACKNCEHNYTDNLDICYSCEGNTHYRSNFKPIN